MRGMELKNEIEEARNYIFYVSDYIDVSAGHAWKMDCRQAMTEQMVQNLPNCKVMKYTEYHGECLDADSVGILVNNQIITGANGRINPKAKATRAETAVMLQRILEVAFE